MASGSRQNKRASNFESDSEDGFVPRKKRKLVDEPSAVEAAAVETDAVEAATVETDAVETGDETIDKMELVPQRKSPKKARKLPDADESPKTSNLTRTQISHNEK